MAASRLTITRRAAMPPRPARQRDGDDHRQQLRRQPHRQRQREQQRLQPGPVEQDVHRQHEQHQEDGEPQDQQPEPADADARTRSAARRAASVPASPPSAVAAPGAADHERCAVPLMTEVPMKTALVAAAGSATGGRQVAGALLGRVGLAGQQRLVDEQVARLEQPRVGRHQVARGQPHHVAGHQRLDRQLPLRAVAPHRRPQADRAPQGVDRVLGPQLLDEVEGHARAARSRRRSRSWSRRRSRPRARSRTGG